MKPKPGSWWTPNTPQQRLIDRIKQRQERDAPVIDPTALNLAADEYAEATGDCDELALGNAILTYELHAQP